jgi:hypothetical protein
LSLLGKIYGGGRYTYEEIILMDEIDEMEAGGDDLDDLIAIEVFGCDPWNARVDPSNRGGRRQFHWGYPVGHAFAPRYSADIAAAWHVVDKMVALGEVFIVKGDGLRTGDFQPRWTVMCGNMPRTDSSNLPLAICRAALKAVRAKGLR